MIHVDANGYDKDINLNINRQKNIYRGSFNCEGNKELFKGI